MKITNSSITMTSAHQESSFAYRESMTLEAAKSKDAAGAILTLSSEGVGKTLKESMTEYQKNQEEQAKKRQQENAARSVQQMAENIKTANTGTRFELSDEYSTKIRMLRQMLAALRGEKLPEDCRIKPAGNHGVLDLRSSGYRRMEEISLRFQAGTAVNLGTMERGTTGVGTTWQRITATSGFATETESTTFASAGIVKTADGRSIDFNIEVSMSRAFMSQIDTLEVTDYIKTDPLMINLDTNVGSVSDQKFFFDLDFDGEEEEISFAGKGSGFLALDKNGDGKINDGSELFGTRSGDGFRDLAAYDEDKNGWIDENDSIFSKLRVWTKDENGIDYLMDIRQADVGAIYLGNADTQFSLKNEENDLNGEIKKTGIYLRESTGAVGTLNHVDLVL